LNTANAVSRIFCESTKEILEASTGKKVTYAKTIQNIPQIHLRPEIGCFVLFDGDYKGLMITNFTAESAMALYRGYMLHMGMPEEELAMEYTSDDVIDNIGEIINQIIGKVRKNIEFHYKLVATNSSPTAFALNSTILLTIDDNKKNKKLCRRLCFKIDGYSFNMELTLERSDFLSMDQGYSYGSDEERKEQNHHINLEDYMDAANAMEDSGQEKDKLYLDFEELLKDNE